MKPRMPNFISNHEDEEEKDEQPTLRTTININSDTTKVMASDLRNFVKSKEDL